MGQKENDPCGIQGALIGITCLKAVFYPCPPNGVHFTDAGGFLFTPPPNLVWGFTASPTALALPKQGKGAPLGAAARKCFQRVECGQVPPFVREPKEGFPL